MTQVAHVSIDPQAAYFSGHFPGNPLVPGVVVLEQVAAQVLQSCPQPAVLTAITMVKFLSPLKPGETLTIEWDANAADVRFHCRVATRAIAQGILRVTHP
jgi:3-hydroxyacyl-[acyl-carrier-protein] dehydratase